MPVGVLEQGEGRAVGIEFGCILFKGAFYDFMAYGNMIMGDGVRLRYPSQQKNGQHFEITGLQYVSFI